MNLPVILLISKRSDTKRLLEEACPADVQVRTAHLISDGLRLCKEIDPILLVCEGTPSTLAPVFHYVADATTPVPVVVLGEQPSVKDAVAAMRAGAVDFLGQPVQPHELRSSIQHHMQHRASTRAWIPQGDGFSRLISVSPQMNLMQQLAREVAQTDATVLISGESGTGKELFAQAIHAASPRANGPIVALNCAGIPETLLEAELFGYQQGAFTDAKHAKLGRFQLAEGGTLFLDEIGEMSSTAQAKLLRVLESRAVDMLGDTKSHPVDIRVIAATNEDLLAQIKAGRFRLDLYYRLNVYQLRIPPLRERPDDIEPILQSFLERARRERGCRILAIAPAALTILQRHDWPGNIRELHNLAEWLTITCKDDIIQPHHLPAFGLSIQEMEKHMLEEALRKASGNVSEASRLLKISRNTLRYRMAKYHLAS
jgi:DNA-binding NtrC family response regulator